MPTKPDEPLILTVNHRLATYLTYQYNQRQRDTEKSTWVSPTILPLETWLQTVWSNHHDARCLLTPYLEWVLWDQAIQKNTQHLPWVARDDLVRKVRQAWQFLNQWNLPFSALRQYPLDETHLFFIRVAEAFESACLEHQVIAACQVMSVLTGASLSGLPQQIWCVGFDDMSPQLAQFFNHLEGSVCIRQTAFYETPTQTSEACRVPFLDPATEIEQAALWAKQCMTLTPNQSVGCIFLNLSESQEKVRQTFQRVFSENPLAFNLSLGRALTEYPVVWAAMQILSFCVHGSIDIANLQRWLYSPFLIASQTEMIPRVVLSGRLVEQGAGVLNWSELETLLSRSDSESYSPHLAAVLNQLDESVRALKTLKQLPSQWANMFVAQLNHFGWPGQRPLDSAERQTVDRFWEALDTFQALDHLHQKMTHTEVFYYLTHCMETTLFQPGTNPQSPIQVMGFLESSGILFDRLWVGGMREDLWPRKPSPNPFIPMRLQKEKQMPHASPERELSISRQITKRFFQSANQVVFSYARTLEERLPLPSVLIQAVQEASAADLFPPKLAETETYTDACEILKEDPAPPLQPDEPVRGGTDILKNQAACPFKAFAHRLGLSRPQKTTLGFSALDKGNLIHKVLEVFWRKVKQQAHLLALSEDELKEQLTTITTQTLQKLISDRPWLTHPAVLDVERERVVYLLLQWLALETQRAPFEVVAIEQPLTLSFNGLSLSVKLDRMDCLEDGTYILLDYKTGRVSLTSWEGMRPDEPQLPFYWVMSEKPVCAIAFGQIHPEAVQFKGVGQAPGLLPHVKEWPEKMAWDALKATWKDVLEKLLQDFCEGKAQVDPKKGAETCRACGFESLCRIYEM